MKTDWLDRTLIAGPYLALVLSSAEYKKAVGDLGVSMEGRNPWILNDHSDATAHYLTTPKGEFACIVAIRLKDGLSGIQIAAMLVHEAVHVWQEFKRHIGEHEPSAEFEAYSIQCMSQRLMESYARRRA